MVTSSHEALHRIFQQDPTLFARTFKALLGIKFPQPTSVSVLNADLTECEPLERRLDTALLVDTDAGRHVIVIESQTAPDNSRRFSWPYYVAYLNNRHSCPVTLLVVTADAQTASWARQPIQVGLESAPTQITQPLVLGPHNVPPELTVEGAREDLMVAVLSALTHRDSSGIAAILETLAAALAGVDVPTAGFLVEFTEVGLGRSRAAQIWRELMRSKYGFESQLHAEWRQEGIEQGRVEEAAAAVLRVLEARGLAVPADVAQQITGCADRALLEELLARAVTVERAEDLFPVHKS
ncbi:MAG TPA: hypothetical protein VF062_12710 [Candidatus Limnocylindrales bacterium]